jgi:LysM repeat protein
MKTQFVRLPAALALLLIASSLVTAVFPAPALAETYSGPAPTMARPSDFACTYVVVPGDTLFRISLRFGVSYFTLAAINGITNFSLIFPGMVLRVPCGPNPPPPTPNVCNIHFVQRGEWLVLIAARFGVSWQSIAALNHLANPSLLFAGQRLLIPCPSGVPGRSITINSPVAGQSVCTPLTTSGSVTVTPFEASLRGRVYNDQGLVIGQDVVHVNGQMGGPGTFTDQIPFDTGRVKQGSLGRVELADISPRDGSVLVSASMSVMFSCGQ